MTCMEFVSYYVLYAPAEVSSVMTVCTWNRRKHAKTFTFTKSHEEKLVHTNRKNILHSAKYVPHHRADHKTS